MSLDSIPYELQAKYECVPTEAKQKQRSLIIRKKLINTLQLIKSVSLFTFSLISSQTEPFLLSFTYIRMVAVVLQSSSVTYSSGSLGTNISRNADAPVKNMNTRNMCFFTWNLSTMAPTAGFVSMDNINRHTIIYPTVIFEYPSCLAYVEPKLRIVAMPANRTSRVRRSLRPRWYNYDGWTSITMYTVSSWRDVKSERAIRR